VFGSCSLCEVNRAQIESLLSKLRQKGHASGTLRGVRTTFSTVLQSALDRGYLDGNAAHGIGIRTTGVKPEARFYTPAQVRMLLIELSEPCRTVVTVAVLTGMRIGEILALRWKRVDLPRNTLEVAETYLFGRRVRNSENAQQPSRASDQGKSSRSARSASFRPESFRPRRSALRDTAGTSTQFEESLQP